MEEKEERSVVRLLMKSPKYVWINFAVIAVIQVTVFELNRLLLAHMTIHNLETAWDKMIPFVPYWITVYYLSFFQWAAGVLLIGNESRKHSCFWATAYSAGVLIAGVMFLVYPGTLDRPEITGSGFWSDWIRFTYWVDSPNNLFPSLHVLASYFCWRGIADCESQPKWFKLANLVFLPLVCLSILFVKQHVIIDIPSAIIVAEAGIFLTRRFKLDRFMLELDNKILGGN